ncbi:hypothetical protein, partial [uncultured Flavobacterium sp.]|uniref:hypothetical protein n=1 Tax=uncultured Flavobacterium sp. TaxID=165435 RepID=UPI0025D5D6C3
ISVNEFCKKLIEKRNKYLIENYAIVDINLNYESQFNNLKWLRALDAIQRRNLMKSIMNSKLCLGTAPSPLVLKN